MLYNILFGCLKEKKIINLNNTFKWQIIIIIII